MANTTIQIRIDEKTKKLAAKKFKEAGMNISFGIKHYLLDVANAKIKPKVTLTENGYTPEFEEKMVRQTNWALKHGKRYTSIKALHRDILKS
jgi:antitoxin component of RelBE/YafQ-DinJ toxin-antitoxin module